MATVEQLYMNFSVLAESKNPKLEEDAFKIILTGVKGESSAKRLASQFIARFFKHFPNLAEDAIDALFDLCEDDDVNIRKQAIKDLPSICKVNKENLSKVSDVLVQLLQTDDMTELSMVQVALVHLLELDPKGALSGLFSQILSGDDLIREKAVKFMAVKLKNLPEDMWTPELETYFVDETRKVLQDCTGDEFVIFMKLLSSVKHMQTMKGRSQLIEIVVEQSEMDKPLQVSEPDSIDRLLQCFRQAIPYFSKNVHSDKFVWYMCDQLLADMSSVQLVEDSDVHLDVFKLFAELSSHCAVIEEARLEKVFNKLIEYMPLPPADAEAIDTKEPDFKFSYVECLMYSLHELGRRTPSLLTDEKQADRLKDFKIRLQYFARGVQVYIKQLRATLQGKQGDELKTDENKIRVMALKTVNNINILIKDLFHNPPSYKATITLSWRPVQTKTVEAASVISPGQKRSSITPITFDNGGAKRASRGDRATYQPPTGKFSEKAGDYPSGLSRPGNGNWRGGRGGRGRGGRGGPRGRFFKRY